MPTLKEIKKQIQHLDGLQQFLGRREIKELPRILWENECLENIIQGTYNDGNGVLVATNKRLIFVDKGFVVGLKVEDFPYDKISSIQYETGILMGTLVIFASGNKAEIKKVAKNNLRGFAEWVRARISAPQPSVTVPNESQTHATHEDTIAQLERLAKLRAYTKIDFLLIKRAWQPTLSSPIDLQPSPNCRPFEIIFV